MFTKEQQTELSNKLNELVELGRTTLSTQAESPSETTEELEKFADQVLNLSMAPIKVLLEVVGELTPELKAELENIDPEINFSDELQNKIVSMNELFEGDPLFVKSATVTAIFKRVHSALNFSYGTNSVSMMCNVALQSMHELLD